MADGGSSVADRQRQRTQRGVATRNAERFGTDRPAPPRRRRPALAALAVLLIVGGAALAGLLALRLDSREPVLALGRDVPAGSEITADMLTTTNVASDGLRLVPEGQINEVVGTYTTAPLAQGQLLETAVLTRAVPIADDRVQIGIPLTPGSVPSGLRSGDLIRLIRTGDGNNPPLPIATGLVLSTGSSESGGSLGGGGESSDFATILVPTTASDLAVDSSANDILGIALIQRGVSIEDARLVPLGGSS